MQVSVAWSEPQARVVWFGGLAPDLEAGLQNYPVRQAAARPRGKPAQAHCERVGVVSPESGWVLLLRCVRPRKSLSFGGP